MALFKNKFRIESSRLKDWDYSTPWWYYVTFCTKNFRCWFGEVNKGEMILNDLGKIAYHIWKETPNHYPAVELDYSVIMPNHVHGILVFRSSRERARHAVPLQDSLGQRAFAKPDQGSLPTVIGSFKSAVTKRINAIHKNGPIWQRNYYEHVVRDDDDLNSIRDYIATFTSGPRQAGR